MTRYFVGRDSSGHRYLVPFDRRREWMLWADLPEDDERSWNVPEYANRLDGGVLTFTNPEIF